MDTFIHKSNYNGTFDRFIVEIFFLHKLFLSILYGVVVVVLLLLLLLNEGGRGKCG